MPTHQNYRAILIEIKDAQIWNHWECENNECKTNFYWAKQTTTIIESAKTE